MKAAFREQYCSPKEIIIQSVDIPVIIADEVLIRIRSTTVNRTDCANLSAKPFIGGLLLVCSNQSRLFLGLILQVKLFLSVEILCLSPLEIEYLVFTIPGFHLKRL